MRKMRGYTFISTVIILALISVISYFIFLDTDSMLSTYAKEQDQIQGSYYAESIINIVLSKENSEKLNDSLKKICFNKEREIPFNINFPIEDFNYTIDLLKNTKYKDGFSIKVNGNYRGIKSCAIASGNMINRYYKEKSGVLNTYTIDNIEDFNNLKEMYSKLDEYFKDFSNVIILDNNDYYLENDGGYLSVYKIENEEKLECHRIYKEKYVYISQKEGNLIIADNTNLKGVINVSNLILMGDIALEGMLNLNNTVVSENNSIYINGILANFTSSGENHIFIDSKFSIIKSFGKYLPDFIKPTIYSLKKL